MNSEIEEAIKHAEVLTLFRPLVKDYRNQQAKIKELESIRITSETGEWKKSFEAAGDELLEARKINDQKDKRIAELEAALEKAVNWISLESIEGRDIYNFVKDLLSAKEAQK